MTQICDRLWCHIVQILRTKSRCEDGNCIAVEALVRESIHNCGPSYPHRAQDVVTSLVN